MTLFLMFSMASQLFISPQNKIYSRIAGGNMWFVLNSLPTSLKKTIDKIITDHFLQLRRKQRLI